jgi:hypothetical protein
MTVREAPAGERAGTGSAARLGAVHPGLGWGGAFLALLALPLLVRNGYQQYLLDLIMINIVLAVGLNIVKGFAGQVNVGHVALAAIGAYTSAVLSTEFGVPFWFALRSRHWRRAASVQLSACRRFDSRAPTWPWRRSALPNRCACSSASPIISARPLASATFLHLSSGSTGSTAITPTTTS